MFVLVFSSCFLVVFITFHFAYQPCHVLFRGTTWHQGWLLGGLDRPRAGAPGASWCFPTRTRTAPPPAPRILVVWAIYQVIATSWVVIVGYCVWFERDPEGRQPLWRLMLRHTQTGLSKMGYRLRGSSAISSAIVTCRRESLGNWFNSRIPGRKQKQVVATCG